MAGYRRVQVSSPLALSELPGGELVEEGLRDLADGRETIPALLVASFSTRMRCLGLTVPEHQIADPELRLYGALAVGFGDGAHGRYNALRQRMVSFAHSYGCVK
jgi:hypothetical protein